MTRAYSYLRFSTPEQAKGDSFRRQTALAEEYAHRHSLELDTELTFRDLGVSAFRGKNAETGRLGDFLRAVDDGLVPVGSYLLVESLDRISRQAARKALRALEDLVDRGVVVVTLNDQRAYTKDSLDSDPMALMLALLTFIRANEESETKGRRVRAAWKGKRSATANGEARRVLTARAPAWLELAEDGKSFRPIPDRQAIVRRIFNMLGEGIGQQSIAVALNKDEVPTFGDNGTKRRASMWHRSYVAKIADNVAVIGTLIPHENRHDADGRKIRQPLEPIPDYYPAIVDLDLFQRVQAMRSAGRAPAGPSAKPELRTLVAGLAKCPRCGASMTRVMKGSVKKAGLPKLVCVKAKTGAGCEYVSVRVADVEKAIIQNVEYLARNVPSGDESLDADIEKAERDLVAGDEAIGNLLNLIQRSRSPMAEQRLREVEAEREAIQNNLSEWRKRAASSSAVAVRKRVQELSATLMKPTVDVTKANALLRQSFTAIAVDYNDGQLRLEWKQGGETTLDFAWPRSEGSK